MQGYSREDLVNLIKELTGLDELTPLISRQINNYILDFSMNFRDIARCLVYWVEVRNKSLEPQYGIGIVPSIRVEAANYFQRLAKEKASQQKEAQKIIEFHNNDIIVTVKKRVKKPKNKFLDISKIVVPTDEDENENNENENKYNKGGVE